MRVGLNGIERIVRADGDDRDLQLIAQVLDDIQKVPLLEHRPGQHVLNFVDDQQFYTYRRQQLHDLELQIPRRLRGPKRREDLGQNRLKKRRSSGKGGAWTATIGMHDGVPEPPN